MNAVDAPLSARVRVLALMVACAFFMEQMDATVLATSLPALAESFGASPLTLNLSLTSYLVGQTAFLPATGAVADRFGTKRVFILALVVFTLASLVCGLAGNLTTLLVARFVQGVGAAMMSPVGRLVLLRNARKSELVRAMQWVLIPTMVAPILGPLVGGLLTTYLSWRWIFYINIPIGIVGLVMALKLLPDGDTRTATRFDLTGAVLCGVALSAVVSSLELLFHRTVTPTVGVALLAAGIASGWLYVVHHRRRAAPALDFTLLRIRTFRIATGAGVLFRVGVGAFPFLMPLMLQLGFGYSPFASGAITFVTGLSALAVKLTTVPLLRSLGYRNALVWNSVLGAAFLFGCAAFRPDWPITLMYAVLLLGGFARSLQFNAFGTIAFADVPSERMAAATALHSVVQQLSTTLGISIAAAVLAACVDLRGATLPALGDYSVAFTLFALATLISAPICARLAHDDGAELSGQRSSVPQAR